MSVYSQLFPLFMAIERFVSSSSKAPETLIYTLQNYKSTIPQDTLVNNDITQYCNSATKKYQPSTLRIGIFYANEKSRSSSKIIEAILADPLSDNNKPWFNKIQQRNKSPIVSFQYSPTAVVSDNTCDVPSPILGGIYRPTYNFEPEQFPNDLIIDEINQDISTVKVTNYTFLICVDDQIKLNQFNEETQNKIFLNVIDNESYSPPSIQDTPIAFTNEPNTNIIKINSKLAVTGIEEFLEKDVAVASEYLQDMRDSNIYELLKAITWMSNKDTVNEFLLNNIKTKIAKYIKSAKEPQENHRIAATDIAKFAEFVNRELQDEFQPQTQQFFKKKLNWWRLYYKNDNVEYDIKDFFNAHFMNKSIEKYNFLNGKIAGVNDVDELSNPLSDLKTTIINERVSQEVQPLVIKTLASAFIYYQLPIGIIAALSYQFFGFSANASIALLSLGLVVGFNQVSRIWIEFTHNWLTELFEEIRVCLSKECIEKGLLKQSDNRLAKDIKLAELRTQTLEQLN
ncbi:uncharacterized protein SPAPADRAFT_55461 [Spathaspora passalidarum NRRL Y-27907]|uniref:Mmc1 C-terminal domain-containing protein n=1 Tax=Spathaspora passalidarum (strain NRRL Y-27907 / 11-Y1) TaxID=619300 RepID=G3AKL0_SPAPN|nr:uncharacterized protein SPAPADRAFT_55461 [Spathaspora passalidarum NRRL Y-27907]EGW33615.1 hypothetical protein SPAPADRAFT_55461 [Spathaspora passalidarum NRRL Y-27907]